MNSPMHAESILLHPGSVLALARTLELSLQADEYLWELASFALGVFVHLGLFRHGEWDLLAALIVQGYAVAFALTNAVFLLAAWSLHPSAILAAIKHASVLLGSHGLGLAFSICVYRLLFHRLRGIPGPPLAAVSGFYMQFMSLTYHHSDALKSYHDQYGDYVRICPNKVSITDPAAFSAIYGRQSPTLKGPFANTVFPRTNMNQCRDKAEHSRRRKFWDRAFATSSLRNHITTVNKYANGLLTRLQAHAGKNVDVVPMLGLFSFDVLFDVAFGQDGQRLRSGREDDYMTIAQLFLKLSGLVMHVPWMMHLVTCIPSLKTQLIKFGSFSARVVSERLAKPGDRGDLFSIISRSYDELHSKTPQDLENLIGDADLLVLAGADSIAACISSILYHLAIDPKRQDELRQTLAEIDDLEDLQLRGHAQLDSYIYETLRLCPPAPAGHERITPPEGLQIGNHYIPGGVTVFVPHYTMFRDLRFFDMPDSFIPERWTSRPDLRKNSSKVYHPFQLGKNACVGKALALMEIRTIIYSILTQYAIEPASPNIKQQFIDGRDDRWLLASGKLDIYLSELAREIRPRLDSVPT